MEVKSKKRTVSKKKDVKNRMGLRRLEKVIRKTKG